MYEYERSGVVHWEVFWQHTFVCTLHIILGNILLSAYRYIYTIENKGSMTWKAILHCATWLCSSCSNHVLSHSTFLFLNECGHIYWQEWVLISTKVTACVSDLAEWHFLFDQRCLLREDRQIFCFCFWTVLFSSYERSNMKFDSQCSWSQKQKEKRKDPGASISFLPCSYVGPQLIWDFFFQVSWCHSLCFQLTDFFFQVFWCHSLCFQLTDFFFQVFWCHSLCLQLMGFFFFLSCIWFLFLFSWHWSRGSRQSETKSIE